MTNKFRRSVTSVLLAASLLFSSQSVIAFADYGSKSDTSDLSPVQESVEPVIGESQAMMAAPMNFRDCMERANFAPGQIRIIGGNHDAQDAVEAFLHNSKGDGFPCENHLHKDDDIHFTSKETVLALLNEILHPYGFEVDYYTWEHDNSDQHDHGSYQGTCWTIDRGNEIVISVKPIDDDNIPNPDDDKYDDWKNVIKVDVECDDNDDGHGDACEHCGQLNHECEYDKDHRDDDDCICDEDDVFEDVLLSSVDNTNNNFYTIVWDGSRSATVNFDKSNGQAWADKFHEQLGNRCPCDGHFFCSYDSNHHEKTDSISLEWNGKNWKVKGDHDDIDIDVHCNGDEKPQPPVKPTKPKYEELIDVVVDCITADVDHPDSFIMPLVNGTYSSTWNDRTKPSEVVVTIQNTSKYIEWYNTADGATHTAVSGEYKATMTWDKNTKSWSPATITIKATCTPVPAPEKPNYTNIQVVLDCVTEDSHSNSDPIFLTDDGLNRVYTSTWNDEEKPNIITVTLANPQEDFVDKYKPNDKNHTVVDNTYSVQLEWLPIDGNGTYGWTVDDKPVTSNTPASITVEATCIPSIDQDDLAKIWVNFTCPNKSDHDYEHWTNLASAIPGMDYQIENVSDGIVEVSLLNLEQWVENYCNAEEKGSHIYLGTSPESLTLHWNGENWVSYEISRSSDANSFTIGILCGPTDEEVKNLLAANIRCINDKATHEESERYYDQLLDNSFEIGNIIHQSDAEYLCDVTVNPSLYLNDFYSLTGGIEHSLVARTPELGSITVPLLYNIESKQWKLVNKDDSPVNFSVACTTQDPIDPPTEEQVEALFDGVVTVDCINPNVVHPTRTYGITKDQFEIGDVWSMVPYANSETTSASFVDVSINVNASHFFNLYDTETGHASINRTGSVPTIIRLMFNNETNTWEKFEPAGSINLTVTCTTGGGTIDPNPNPGGGGDNDDDDDRYTGDNTVTRTINDDDVPLNDRPTNNTTIDDEDVPLADLPDDTVTIDDGEVPLKDNPSTGDSLPFAAMAAAALSLGGVIVLNRKKK